MRITMITVLIRIVRPIVVVVVPFVIEIIARLIAVVVRVRTIAILIVVIAMIRIQTGPIAWRGATRERPPAGAGMRRMIRIHHGGNDGLNDC